MPARENILWDQYLQITKAKCTGGVAPVVEHLFYKCWNPEFKPQIPPKRKEWLECKNLTVWDRRQLKGKGS
jgi:hypothetical protein